MTKKLPQSVTEMKDILDIEGVVHSSTAATIKTVLIAVLVLLILLVLFWLIRAVWKTWAKKRTLQKMAPDERALKALAKLKKTKFIEGAQWHQYYFALDEILRRYIDARFGFDVLEKTYEEIKILMNEKQAPQEFLLLSQARLKSLKDFWLRSQGIKFAKMPATFDECGRDFDMVKGFVFCTKDEGRRTKDE